MMLSSLMGPGQQQRPPDQNDPRFQRRGAGLSGSGFQGFPAGMYGPLSHPGLWSLMASQPGFSNSAASFEQAQQGAPAAYGTAMAGPQSFASDYVPSATTGPSPSDFWGSGQNNVAPLLTSPQLLQRLQ